MKANLARRMGGAFGLLLAVGVMAAPLDGQAQRGAVRMMGGMGMNLDEQVTQLTERLELTDEQSEQLRTILEEQVASMRQRLQAMAGGGGNRGAMRGVMREMQEATREKLAEVLTEEQMEKYQAFVDEQRQRRGPPPLR